MTAHTHRPLGHLLLDFALTAVTIFALAASAHARIGVDAAAAGGPTPNRPQLHSLPLDSSVAVASLADTATLVPLGGLVGDSCATNADCNDADPCTIDTCDASLLCQSAPAADSTPCDDGLFCTAADSCQAGTCVGAGDPCAGGAECASTCNEAGATCNAAAGTPCNDATACTDTDTCDGTGTCAGIDACTGGLICDLPSGQCAVPPGDPDNDGLVDQADPCPLEPRNLCFGAVAVDGLTTNEIRLNANAISGSSCQGTRIDCNGDTWLADFAYNQAGNGAECNLIGGCPIAGISAIFGCSDAATEDLFQCEHWDPMASPALTYDFSVPNGRYLVNLLFAATFKSGLTGPETVGSRVFDIIAEGAIVYDDFDQVAATGGIDAGVAVVRSAVIDVLDGNGLQLEFGHEVENPAIKAIEVLAGPLACIDATDCDDANPCTADSCVTGFCQNDASAQDGLGCDDGLFCTASDICQAGSCSGSGDPCSGGGQCADTCDEASDSCNLATGSACDLDGDVCTVDQCDGLGACSFVAPNSCDDGNECTVDSCAAGACVNNPLVDGTACDDGLFCTATDTCQTGTCTGTGDTCAGGAQCANSCDEAGATCILPAGAACDLDGDLCSVDQCDGLGSCGFVSTVTCQASDQCDGGEQCNPSTGACDALADAAAGTPCNDNAACTTPDTCDGLGACLGIDTCSGGLVCDLVGGQCQVPPGDPDNDGLFDEADPCPLDARNHCYGPVASDGNTGNDIRVNANAIVGAGCQGTRIDCAGDTWLADFGYNQVGNGAECNLDGGCPISGISEIFGCSDAATEDIFQCEHWDPSLAPNLIYDFAVADGNYIVNLLFASTFKSGSSGPEIVGDRVFDILMEDVLVYDDFDHVAASGGNGVAVVRSAVVTVADGDGLQIELAHVDSNPAIKGIEVLFEATPCADAAACDDGNDCTVDLCPDAFCRHDGAPMEALPCDDGLFCTAVDACQAGSCTGSGDPCAGAGQCADTCNEAADTCILAIGTACDLDGDLCTIDQCDGLGTCSFAANVGCQTGGQCTGGETCNPVTGVCDAVADPVAGTACDLDGDLCTTDQCDGLGICSFVTNVVCSSADQCDGGSVCNSATGLCDDLPDALAGTACEADGSMCTVDACDGLGLCVEVSTVTCQAATDCAGGEICNAATGLCETQTDAPAGTPCTDDGNACTDNECDGAGVCLAIANISPCDDGQFCNGLDFCSAGLCTLHSGDPCASGETCDETSDICQAADCVSLTLADPVQCFSNRDCTIALSMDAGAQPVSSVFGTLTSPLAIDCSDACIAGSAAINGSCAADGASCNAVVADIETPVSAFANGEVAGLTIRCNQTGVSQICFADQAAGLVDGTPATVCADDCVAFDCSSCLSGDCNQSGQIDAGDPICSVLCLIGQAPPGADCSCAADCNCLGGTEAGDPICAVLRLIDDFTPDTCAPAGGGGPVLLATRGDTETLDVALKLRGPRLGRSGRAGRARVRLVGTQARLVAGVHASLAANGPLGRIGLARRLRVAGFSLTAERSQRGHAAIVVTPPLSASGVAPLGKGRMLRIRLPQGTAQLSITADSFGSVRGLPLRGR